MRADLFQSVIALALKVLAAVSVLILNAVITRVLTIEEAGSYLVLNALVLFWIMASANGVPQILMRWVASQRVRGSYSGMEKNIIKGMAVLVVVGGISAYLLLTILSQYADYFSAESLHRLKLLIVVWICLGLVLRLMGEVYRGLGLAQAANMVTAVNSHGIMVTLIVAVILIIINLQRDVSLDSIIQTYIGVLILMVLLAGSWLIMKVRALKKNEARIHAEPEEIFNKKMLKSGLMLSLAELSIYVITQGDVWIVERYGAGNDVALYGIAAKMAFLTSLFLIAINSVLPSRVAAFVHGDKTDALQLEIKNLVRWAFAAALLWLIVCILFGELILGITFGQEYKAAKTFLVILSLGHLVSVATGPCGLLLLMFNKESALLRGTLLVFIIYIAAVIPIGTAYGAIGVACCSAAAFALVNVVYAVLVRKMININSGIISF